MSSDELAAPVQTIDEQGRLVFTTDFLQRCADNQGNGFVVEESRFAPTTDDPAFLAEKYEAEGAHPVGVLRYEWTTRNADGNRTTGPVILKSKTSSTGYKTAMAGVFERQGMRVDGMADLIGLTDLSMTDVREVEAYRLLATDEAMAQIAPGLLGSYIDESENLYVHLMQPFSNEWLSAVGDLMGWTEQNRREVIGQLAVLHGTTLANQALVEPLQAVRTGMNLERMGVLAPFWQDAYRLAARQVGDVLTEDEYEQFGRALANWEQRWREIDATTKCVVHADVQPKNIAVPADRPPLLFDWEVATVHLPARDGVEFLINAAPDSISDVELAALIEHHRAEVERISGIEQPIDRWRRQYELALDDYQTTRYALYLAIEEVESHDIYRGQRILTRLRRILQEG